MPDLPPDLLRRPFRGSEALRQGLLTRGRLRTSAWRRLRPDVYVAADRAVTHLTHADAVALVAPPQAVFGGRTAAVRHGARPSRVPPTPSRWCCRRACAGIRRPACWCGRRPSTATW